MKHGKSAGKKMPAQRLPSWLRVGLAQQGPASYP